MILSPYTPEWAERFRELEAVWIAALGELQIGIEHIGSTAIPKMAAKPVLDVDVIIPQGAVLAKVISVLQEIGYEHEGDLGIAERDAFRRFDERVPWKVSQNSWMDHHLYVCPKESRELRRHLAFRDALRGNEELRNEYERMKRDVELRSGGDRKLYASMKMVECSSFIEGVLQAGTIEPTEAESR